jgi:hypothetical protein
VGLPDAGGEMRRVGRRLDALAAHPPPQPRPLTVASCPVVHAELLNAKEIARWLRVPVKCV